MEQVTTKQAIDKLIHELTNDHEYYYGWQSNIALAFFDTIQNFDENLLTPRQLLEQSNKAAKRFLNQLCNKK